MFWRKPPVIPTKYNFKVVTKKIDLPLKKRLGTITTETKKYSVEFYGSYHNNVTWMSLITGRPTMVMSYETNEDFVLVATCPPCEVNPYPFFNLSSVSIDFVDTTTGDSVTVLSSSVKEIAVSKELLDWKTETVSYSVLEVIDETK